MNLNYQEIIKIDERHLRNVFTYIVELNTPEGLTIYQIQSNDQNSENKSWIKMENLFDLLQDFMKG